MQSERKGTSLEGQRAAPAAAAPPPPAIASLVDAVSPAYETFRTTAAAAAEGVRSILSRRGPAAPAAAGLGLFGRSRIDPDRFAGLATREEALDAASIAALRAAADVLRAAAATPAADAAASIVVRVEPGARMRDVVRAALTSLGRVFGAARVASLARSGRYRPESHAGLLTGLDPAAWTPRERGAPPPLVVDVDGADLDAAGLATFIDGRARFAVHVRAPATPAPLVRLLTPRTFVVQAADASGLAGFSRSVGPAVAAIVPDGCACFVHDPAAALPAARVAVQRMPAALPRDVVGAWSAAQQADELALLAEARDRCAPTTAPARAAPVAPETTGSPGMSADGDPASRLAAWLLASVDESRLR